MARVLIVDDSRTSRRMLREILEGMGHEVAGEAANGEEGYLMYKGSPIWLRLILPCRSWMELKH